MINIMNIEIITPFRITFDLLDIEFDTTLVFSIVYSLDIVFGRIKGECSRCSFSEQEWRHFLCSLRKQELEFKSGTAKLVCTSGDLFLSIYENDNRFFFQLTHYANMYCEETRMLENRFSNTISMPLEIEDFIHIKKAFLEFPIWNDIS